MCRKSTGRTKIKVFTRKGIRNPSVILKSSSLIDSKFPDIDRHPEQVSKVLLNRNGGIVRRSNEINDICIAHRQPVHATEIEYH